MPEVLATITAEKLAQLTGFSVVELAKLAAQGYFPRSRGGLYEQNRVIPGCFRACQERLKQGAGLPTYQSMAECATQTGIPRSILKEARKHSPESFRSHRIQLGALLRWIFSQNGDDENWGERLKKAQALREEIRLAKDKQQALDKGEATTAIAKAVSVFFAALDRHSDEMPAILQGMDAAAIKAQLSANAEGIKTQLRSALEKLIHEAEANH